MVSAEHFDDNVPEIRAIRPGTPEEIATVAAVVASGRPAFVTGASLGLTGGQSMGWALRLLSEQASGKKFRADHRHQVFCYLEVTPKTSINRLAYLIILGNHNLSHNSNPKAADIELRSLECKSK